MSQLLVLLAAVAAAATPTPVKKAAKSVTPAAIKASTTTAAAFDALPVYPASTAPVTVALVLERFTAFDESLKSLKCDFAQSVNWQASGTAQSVEGTLEYRKPELLHIDQRAPEPQTMVSDGSWLWVWRKSTDQVIQTKLEDWKRSEPLAQGLLDFGDYAGMLKKYDASISSVAASDAQGYRRVELALRPKEKDKAGDFALTLRLDTRDYFPFETELRAGQVVVRSRFKNVLYNPALADERFKFTPPPGADVFPNFKPPKPE